MMLEHDGESYIRLSDFIENEVSPIIMAPFMGGYVPVIVNRLNYAQIRACGDFSLIETTSDIISNKRKLSPAEMIAYAEMQYNIVKASLRSPSYDEIMGVVYYSEISKGIAPEIEELESAIAELPVGPKRDILKSELDTLRMDYEFLLPADFVAYIVSYALKVDDSDIKLVSEDMLMEAACMAKNGNDNPSDHLPGNFSEFNREDINKRAWIIYAQRMRDKTQGGATIRR